MDSVNFIVWRVTTPTEKGKKRATYLNYKTAKIAYGKACKSIIGLNKKAILEVRTSVNSKFIVLQEMEYENSYERETIGNVI